MALNTEAPTFVKLAEQWNKAAQSSFLRPSYSYADVLIVPQYSQVRSLDEVSTDTNLVPGIPMHIPIVSANMDSVTEAKMAILAARMGGIGVMHRAMGIKDQVDQVKLVKDATQVIVFDPPRLPVSDTVGKAREVMAASHRGFIVTYSDDGKFAGMVTTRDLRRESPADDLLSNVMKPRDKLIVARDGIDKKVAQRLMYEYRIEKLPLIDSEENLAGVITQKDIDTIEQYPHATMDGNGRLQVGAAVGVQAETMKRAQALIEEAEVDFLVVDVLQGDSPQVYEIIKQIKERYPQIPVIGGNVATGDATDRMIKAGASGVKVGFGNGALCTTRVKTGTGRGQFTAVVESAAVAYRSGREVTIIADGSIQDGGDLVTAIAAGGNSAMIGTLLSGTDQSPGEIVTDYTRGIRYKEIRGMASLEAHERLARARGEEPKKRTPQGISARIAYVGDATPLIDDLVGGIKSGIANAGARDIKGLQEIVIFEELSSGAHTEGKPHFLESGRSR